LEYARDYDVTLTPVDAPAPVTDNVGRPYRLGEILTFTGRRVRPLDLRPEDIDPLDIAHALACQNRFTGHAREPYSVAQHCVLVSLLMGETMPRGASARDVAHASLCGLLHDASEAYLVDVASPVKNLPELARFREIEEDIQAAIEQRFGLHPGDLHSAAVKAADRTMLATEARDLMPDGFNLEGVTPDPARVVPWSWYAAQARWLDTLEALYPSATD
jgi:hypothetical protein